jgi:hypothetical protein
LLSTFGHIPFSQVQPKHVTAWLDSHAGWNSTTKRSSVIAVQRCFRWAE